ncbi:serine/threonine-protein phosphatase [Infirmifilum lucidum]|uniref:Serine/threonine-protein phosphatase n=1 Tax=Infirmifilum lucidum TaxID=2776706 RepID=A0A7L9FFY1_9CREN|nr:protein phosphatase 2C domain-containing protein [Infirmifilum lucidum]QOJ78649.1 serine/threonine-protein phosphatase [Infirmifilum lucidum]
MFKRVKSPLGRGRERHSLRVSGASIYSMDDLLLFSFSLDAYIAGERIKAYVQAILAENTLANLMSSILDGLHKGEINPPTLRLSREEAILFTKWGSIYFESGGSPYLYLRHSGRLKEIAGKTSLNLDSGVLLLASQRLNQVYETKLGKVTAAMPPDDLVDQLAPEVGVDLSVLVIRAPLEEKFKHRMFITSGCASDVGRRRKNNEDSCFTSTVKISRSRRREVFRLAGVADGAGGHGYGELASALAVEDGLKHALHAIVSRFSVSASDLRSIVQLVNQRVLDAKRRMKTDMASTLTLATIKGRELTYAHVGDSRLYIVDSNMRTIQQLTRDHKYVDELVERGLLTPEQARTHPQRNIITSAIGMEKPRIDTYSYPDVFIPPRKIILCSDGLSDVVFEEEILRLVSSHRIPEIALNSLVSLANSRGGPDNISVSYFGYFT